MSDNTEMSLHNIIMLLNRYREKGVSTIRNQHGQIIFCGLNNIGPAERALLFSIPTDRIDKAMHWQR